MNESIMPSRTRERKNELISIVQTIQLSDVAKENENNKEKKKLKENTEEEFKNKGGREIAKIEEDDEEIKVNYLCSTRIGEGRIRTLYSR